MAARGRPGGRPGIPGAPAGGRGVREAAPGRKVVFRLHKTPVWDTAPDPANPPDPADPADPADPT